MASIIYDSFLADLASGAANSSHSYKAMLVTSSYTENRATHTKRSDITNEASGTNYTAGGAAITVTQSLNTTTHVLTLTIGAVSWASSSITARKLIVYRSRGGLSSADELVCCIDNGSDLISISSTMAWNTPTASTWTIPLPAPV
jgi:hypothetical protein